MVAIGSYEPEIYKREEWELKQLREKTMKQNWEKELKKQFGKRISAEALHCIHFIIMHDNVKNGLSEESLWKIARAIQESKQEEKERILKWAKDYIERDMQLFGTDKHGIALEDIEFFLNN